MRTSLTMDIRAAFREMGKAPTTACATILSLALAIGANTSLYSIFYAIVSRPLSVSTPERIVALQATNGQSQQRRPLYYTMYSELARLPVFEGLELYSGGGLFLVEWRGTKREATIEASTPGLFQMLGLTPHAGRFFTEDDAPGDSTSSAVAVLSYDLWQRGFGGDPSVLGDRVLISGTPVDVIGITPRGYTGFQVDGGFGFSVPITLLNRQLTAGPERPVRGLNAVGRLADGVSLEQARAAAQAAWPTVRDTARPAGLSETEQRELATEQIDVSSLSTGFSTLRQTYGEPLRMLWAATGVLLLIGCLNLGALFLVRAAARQPEIALQMALGASKRRIAQRILVESTLLAILGAALAVPLAWWSATAAQTLLWDGTGPLSQQFTPDTIVLVTTSGIAILAGILIGAVPAWRLSRTGTQLGLQSGRTLPHTMSTWVKALLVAQVAFSLVLLIVSGLLATSLYRLRAHDTGLKSDGVRWSRLFAVPNGYRDQNDATYYPQLVQALSEVPQVESVALASYFPSYFGLEPLLPKRSISRAEDGADLVDAIVENVTPQFFESLGIPISVGRDIRWSDDAERPAVAVINRSLQRALFANTEALGQRLRIGGTPERVVEIVGVTDDASIGSYKQPAMPAVFRPRMQELGRSRAPVVVFRTTGEPKAIDAAMETVIAAFGHEYPRRFSSLKEQVEVSLTKERLLASVSAVFATLAAIMTLIGTYAALAYAVRRRTREVGVRMALGAPRSTVVGGLVREGVVLMLNGIALGMPAALWAASLIRSQLFGVVPWEPTMLGFAATSFVLVGLLAALIPAIRASRIDPAVALREG